MATRSWLAKAKSVHEIGGLFYKPLGGKPWDDKQDEQAERRWRKAGVRPLPIAESDRLYFGSRMHDSGVVDITRTGSTLRIGLDSINASDFASYLPAVLDCPRVEAVWPVDLLFHDPRHVRAARADSRGGLRFFNWTRLREAEFRYDWFYAQDGRLQWIAQFWVYDPRGSYDSQNVYLMVDCAKATASDRCPEVFAQTYGAPAADLYRDALAGVDDRPVDFYVFDGHRQTMDYIRRRMLARDLSREDFNLGLGERHAI